MQKFTAAVRQNYDITASIAALAALLIVGAAWPWWTAWAVLVAFQVVNRARNR